MYETLKVKNINNPDLHLNCKLKWSTIDNLKFK